MALRAALASAVPALFLASCAGSVTAPPPATSAAIAPAPVPMPAPPAGAAPGLALPVRTADGFATPNRGLSPAGSVWHLRAALNVAALGCDDPGRSVSGAYNRLLKTHRRALAEAHRALMREYPDRAAFDAAMTRLYNHFSQPPAQPGFCAAARDALAGAEAVPAGELAAYAAATLPALDRPFTDFYAAYDRYLADLAAWRAGGRSAPRLTVDVAALLASDEVTFGTRPIRFAARGSAATAR